MTITVPSIPLWSLDANLAISSCISVPKIEIQYYNQISAQIVYPSLTVYRHGAHYPHLVVTFF